MELEAVARRRTWSESPTGDRSIRAQSNPVTEHPPELDQPEPPSYKAAPSGSSWSGYSCC